MRIRTARPEDASAVADVYVRSWRAAFVGLLPQSYLDAMDPGREEPGWKALIAEARWPSSGVLVAESDAGTAGIAGIVGFTGFGPSREAPAVAEIGTLYTLPEVWSTGTGRQLMRGALTTLDRAAHYTHATLWVLEANARARRFYETTGWSPDGASVTDTTGGASLGKLRYRRAVGEA
ncbi:acetyltransferase [Streptomyces viridochromogenes]|uniref:Acetyltransferase n=1 Tax=Streptomyces viridochromogenes TaxID=1938 RepID=A0A0J7Z5J0_STRVR|nr:GNAT family N-acetyltransferase [Streptomyces viridochromogenes]KMS70458.1 acetyltransferase [Streptomyces viridochromogenes]KOG13611.1 acetyltransferase [Streptomyces viridochromogenes]KOG13849.1 acetyltransferase [Streptomyces viridochromogenes]